MKRFILGWTIFIFIGCLNMHAQSIFLSDSVTVSLLTCRPGEEVYALYGHTALRVHDLKNGFDFAFNYGVFDFNKPHFIYRFTKGETDYILGVVETDLFLEEYRERGSGVIEQILNLSGEEKRRLWESLSVNSLPQNREYRYNFLYDNCSTRPRVMIEKCVSGKIEYPDILPETTFRTLIHHCNRYYRWLTFGIDLALGAPIDKPIGQNPQLFLPEKLMTVFAGAKIVNPDGTSRNLVEKTLYPVSGFPVKDEPKDSNPTVICWLFFAVVLILSAVEIRKRKYFRWLDVSLFLIAGLTGCLLAFLMFVSVHPGTYPNYSFIWLHPVHLLLVLLLLIRSLRKFAVYYFGIDAIVLFLFMCGWKFFPQNFNAAFFPPVLTLYIRSAAYVLVQTKLSAERKEHGKNKRIRHR
ncbi:MAG: DUF4105 domain-containing protein [Candidatus Azobacteroides sp.]|nr:DUF4105 domain-containing protein [Candidatus Azobacteroides sp.]